MGDSDSNAQSALRWLHLSNLQISLRGSLLTQADFRRAFERDLADMHDETGPWDFVAITGDIAANGDPREYEIVTEVLQELWSFFASLGSRPVLLSVPGNRDAARYRNPEDVGKWPIEMTDDQLRMRFAAYEAWRGGWERKHNDVLPRTAGVCPGDFVTRLRNGRLSVGVLGINSDAYFYPRGGYSVAPQRVAAAAGGELPRWSRNHDAVLLLSHHGPSRWMGGDWSFNDWSIAPLIVLAGGVAVGAQVRILDGATLVQGLQLKNDPGSSRNGYLTGALVLSDAGLEVRARARRWSAADAAFRELFDEPAHRTAAVPRLLTGAAQQAPTASGDADNRWYVVPTRAAFSDDGRRRAVVEDRRLTVHDDDRLLWSTQLQPKPERVAMSPRGTWLLIRNARWLELFEVATGASIATVQSSGSAESLLAWLGDDHYAYDDGDLVIVHRIDGREASLVAMHRRVQQGGIRALAAAPVGRRLAIGTNGSVSVIDADGPPDNIVGEVAGFRVNAMAWSRDSRLLVVGHDAGMILLDAECRRRASFEGPTVPVVWVSFSPDETLVGGLTARGELFFVRLSDWATVSLPPRLRNGDNIWAAAFGALPRVFAATVVTAKVVLLGEGSVGKSSLAMRLAQGRFEDIGATHAMQFWPMTATSLDPAQDHPPGERREVVLWDMGGQDEYRLLHRAFLRDTTVAVFVIEPRRGAAAFGELEAWMSQLRDKAGVAKLLVASKLDDDSCPRDRPRAEARVADGTFREYLETSARTPLGIEARGAAIARAIDWTQLGVTVRSALFQRIRDYVNVRRESGRIVIPYLELEDIVRQREGDAFDRRAVDTVVEQMDRQGVISDQRLSDGTRMLVLDVSQVERYAGSLILAARDNPRGVPALDRATVTAPDMVFPRIAAGQRLPRDQEVVVLEAVITTLIEHGICFPSSGMLVFPSLFRALDGSAPSAAGVSTRFDFVGAVDTPYAALVSSLAMSRGFGPVRLWADQADFTSPAGTCGLRRAGSVEQRRRGEGRLEIFFSPDTTPEVRQMFVGVLEDLLRSMGVDISEQVEVACGCGHRFGAEVIRARLERGDHDVVCPIDELRVPLAPPSADGELGNRIRAFRSETEQRRSQIVSEAKADLSNARRDHDMARPIRILHLSDLHIGAGDDVVALLQPLLADLRDTGDGLGERLDYLVVSGDLTNIASPAELANARAFVEALIDETGFSAERCVVVPGNHDLSWSVPAYDWLPARSVARPDPVTHVQQGAGYLVRNAATYAQRFAAFSEHFFHPLFQRPYLLEPERQGGATLFDEHALQFLTFNSAWHIDEWFPDRSGLHAGAVSRTLLEADDAIRKSREAGRLASDSKVLRLAVWHHPLTGNEKMVDDAFAESLRKAGVTACLHGHVHEDRADLVGYWHPTRKLHVIGAGSFGAPAKHRPESTPQLYNLLEIAPDRSAIKVHTRAKRRGPGAWGPWAVWESEKAGERRAWYEIRL